MRPTILVLIVTLATVPATAQLQVGVSEFAAADGSTEARVIAIGPGSDEAATLWVYDAGEPIAHPVPWCSRGYGVRGLGQAGGAALLEVTCREGNGGFDYTEYVTVFAVTDARLRPVLEYTRGVRSELIDRPGCHSAPRGHLRMLGSGSAASIRTVEPERDADGAPTHRTLVRDWSWNGVVFQVSSLRRGPELPEIVECAAVR